MLLSSLVILGSGAPASGWAGWEAIVFDQTHQLSYHIIACFFSPDLDLVVPLHSVWSLGR